MGRAGEGKLACAGLCWSPRLLEGLAAPVGESDGKHSIAEECFMENGNQLSVAYCLCLVLAWGLSLLSPAIKAEPLLQQVYLPLGSSRPAFEAGSRKCLLRGTSKFGAWCRHTNRDCLGPALREHVVSSSRRLR